MDALLALLACPIDGAADWRLDGDPHEGLLTAASGRCYPIIGGVPRMLPPDLLAPFLRRRHPAALARWPQLAARLADAPPAEPAVVDTLTAYTHQHLDLADATLPVAHWRETWDRFQPGLPPEGFAGQAVLEVGCGEGRHAWLVGAHAETLVGLDLSAGVELARQRDPRPNVFYVQGDLRRPPFRRAAFDGLYSNGVLHHTPDPAASFAAVAALLRPGGLASVWVYGLDEMRWSYRISHLTWLRPLTNRLPRRGQLAVAGALTALLEAGLWTPTRALRRVGRADLAERLPFADAAEKDWTYKLRRMFDRLNPPVTHYLDAASLRGWMDGWSQVEVINAEGQGWTARGRAPG